MAGEIWLRRAQLGVEVSYGVAVPATRVAYFDSFVINRGITARRHRASTGSRDNVRYSTVGPQVPTWSCTFPMDKDEIIEMLLIGIKAGVTPAASIWNFTPGNALPNSATIEGHDGAAAYILAGCYANRITIAGNAGENGNNIVTIDGFAKSLVAGSMTGSLVERTPSPLQNWESRFYIDAFGATPVTTVKNDLLVDWSVVLDNQLQRKYWANGVNSMGAAVLGEWEATATLGLEAANAQAATEYANLAVPTKRMLALRFGPDTGYVDVILPSAWVNFAQDQEDAGTRKYSAQAAYVFDATNAYGTKVSVKNARSTAW